MANERLIDANALRDELYEADAITMKGVAIINQFPTVDAVEVVHGYWYEHHGITICSHCQAMFDADLVMLQIPSTWKMPNYCPNCGAKMDGGNEDG